MALGYANFEFAWLGCSKKLVLVSVNGSVSLCFYLHKSELSEFDFEKGANLDR